MKLEERGEMVDVDCFGRLLMFKFLVIKWEDFVFGLRVRDGEGFE